MGSTRGFRLLAVSACSFLVVFGIATITAIGAPEAPLIRVRDEGNPTVVYEWTREHCEEWDVPDAPLRAFRNASGAVVAYVSDDNSRVFSGESLLKIRHTCHSSLPNHEQSDPSEYSGLRYITAVWSTDGKNVTALIHNEYHADHFPGQCLYKDGIKCWYTTILGAFSTDGGQRFSTTQPPTIVAAPAFRQDFQQGRHRGFFNPSNIFFHDGFYYVATDTTGGAGQKPGLCLFRTRTVEDPTSWRAFDGQDYTSRAIDPYRGDTNPYVPCQPVSGPGTVGSISWHQPSGSFLIVFQSGRDATHPSGMTAYSWSIDLIHWSPPTTLYNGPDMSSSNCADSYRYGYPSVADPDAPGRNFDSIGDHPYLFLTRFHVLNCNLPANRDLIRLVLDIKRP